MNRKRWSTRDRLKCFVEAGGICALCGTKIENGRQMELHHVIELAAGGEDTLENIRPCHLKCHRLHTAEHSAPTVARVKRIYAKHIGAKPKHKWPSRPFANRRW